MSTEKDKKDPWPWPNDYTPKLEKLIYRLINRKDTGSPITEYDSGWFAVAAATNYQKAHGLGAIPDVVQVWFSEDSGGANPVTVVGNAMYGGANCLIVNEIDATNITIRGQTRMAQFYATDGAQDQPTSGYAKIKAYLFS